MGIPVWFWNEDTETWLPSEAEKDGDEWKVKYVNEGREREMYFKGDQSSMDLEIDKRDLPITDTTENDTEDVILLYKRKRDISQDNPGEIADVSPSRKKSSVGDVFNEFSNLIDPRNLQTPESKYLMDTLKLLLPNVIEDENSPFVAELFRFCRSPYGKRQLESSHTLAITPSFGKDIGIYNPAIASKLKYSVGEFNPSMNSKVEELLKYDGIFNAFKTQVLEDSRATADAATPSESKCYIEVPPPQPMDHFELILGPELGNFPISVYFDIGTARWIKSILTGGFSNIRNITMNVVKGGLDLSLNVVVYTTSGIVKVGILSLILMFNIAIQGITAGAKTASWVIGFIFKTLFDYRDILFASPFAHITSPSEEENKNRRMKRLVLIYLYTTLKLLSVLKQCPNIEWLKGGVREGEPELLIVNSKPLTGPEFSELNTFISKDISSWTVNEILDHGTRLLNLIVYNQKLYNAMCPALIREFMDLYINSLKYQYELLNARLISSDIVIEPKTTANTYLGSLISIISTEKISQMSPDTLERVYELVRKLVNLHGGNIVYIQEIINSNIDYIVMIKEDPSFEESVRQWQATIKSHLDYLTSHGNLSEYPPSQSAALGPATQPSLPGSDVGSGELDMSGDDMSGGGMSGRGKRNKRSKKKSKKKTNKRKKAGKRKKSSKRKKTKRKSMKQVKEKLINLINSL